MKVFLLRVIVIIFCSSFLLLILEIGQDYINKDNPMADAHVIDKVVSGTVNAELLLLGNSRASTAFNSKIFDSITHLKSFNLGYTAGNWQTQTIYYDLYTNHNKQPTLIVQNIDLPHFKSETVIPNLYDLSPFFHKFDENKKDLFSNYDKFQKRWIPYFKYSNNIKTNYNYFIKSISKQTNERIDFYYPYDKAFVMDSNNLKRIVRDKSAVKIGLIENILINQINAFDGEILYVWLPEYYERFRLYGQEVNDIKKLILKICFESGTCNFLDLSELCEIAMDKNYFYDTFHLNTKGADEVSKIIANYIKECYLIH